MAEITGYDIIGDVHGHLVALEGLLAQLGYVENDGVWAHPERQAIFVGDLVDRGAHQIGTIELVRRMVESGTAQMVIGNHEYNAVAYATPMGDGGFAREHSEKNHRQHEAFLAEVGEGTELQHHWLDWFCTLPLWLEVELGDKRLRVVHACWDDDAMAALEPLLGPARNLTEDAVVATSEKGSTAYDALETVLKGPEVGLAGHKYLDHAGIARGRARRRWWDADATTLRAAALVPPGSTTPDGEPFPELPALEIGNGSQYHDDTPVIVGHYWCTEPLELYSPKVTCVDYSVAGGGPLVAYRWDGEQELTIDHYVVHRVTHPSPEDVADTGEAD